jgi:hypothetical protein
MLLKDNLATITSAKPEKLVEKDAGRRKRPRPPKTNSPILQAIADAAAHTLDAWRHGSNLAYANSQLPVASSMAIPKRGMFVIMLIFSIIIGPATMIILARKNRRIWLLWIAPALSAVVCILTALYSIFSEGVTPTVNSVSVTLLDQQTHHATTIGMLGLYCPLTPSGGLHFTPDSEIATYGVRRYQTGSGKSIDWTEDQSLESGWVSARVPAFFMLRIPETRRERVEITSESNKTYIFNGLGATITEFWLQDDKGNWLTTDGPLKKGAKTELIAAQHPPSATKYNIRALYSSVNWIDSFKQIKQHRDAFLQPGMYLAVLDGSPFLPHGLSGRVHNKQKSYVIGFTK